MSSPLKNGWDFLTMPSYGRFMALGCPHCIISYIYICIFQVNDCWENYMGYPPRSPIVMRISDKSLGRSRPMCRIEFFSQNLAHLGISFSMFFHGFSCSKTMPKPFFYVFPAATGKWQRSSNLWLWSSTDEQKSKRDLKKSSKKRVAARRRFNDLMDKNHHCWSRC